MVDGRGVEALRGREGLEHPDRVIARLAERQYGIVARRQLLDLGLSAKEIRGRVEVGRLYCLHRGVYAVGRPQVNLRGRYLAAVLSAGARAFLSHQSVGNLMKLCRWAGPIDVTVPTSRKPRRGICWHATRLPVDEVTTLEGIPVTTPSRTVFDLAAALTLPRLASAVNLAEHHRLDVTPSLPTLLHRYPRRPGTPKLRRVLAERTLGGGVGETELELQFLDFLDERGLPMPDANRWVEVDGRMYRPDCLYRDRRLVVELDSWEHHGSRDAFENDRARARKLSGAGYKVLQVTSRDISQHADALDRDLRRMLTGQ
jgi:hypothetical protein